MKTILSSKKNYLKGVVLLILILNAGIAYIWTPYMINQAEHYRFQLVNLNIWRDLGYLRGWYSALEPVFMIIITGLLMSKLFKGKSSQYWVLVYLGVYSLLMVVHMSIIDSVPLTLWLSPLMLLVLYLGVLGSKANLACNTKTLNE